MQIKTYNFGEIECKEEDIIVFPKGLIGFPEEDQFIILSHVVQEPFLWLQSIKNSDLAFVVLDPWVVQEDYQVVLTEEVKSRLKITEESEVMILGIVVTSEDPAKMTVNLRAPLLIHVAARLGEQFILPDDKYSVRHPILSVE